MSSELNVGKGYCLAFGGTNAREAYVEQGEITGYSCEITPESTEDFFRWMARRILDVSETDVKWVVAGFPGPVSRRGDHFSVGPMKNIPGLSENAYDLETALGSADPACTRLFEEGFRLEALNDGDLAGQAAARLLEQDRSGEFNVIGDVILGTGLGAAVVTRDRQMPEIFRPSGMPLELGHVMDTWYTSATYENAYSGTALEKSYGIEPKNLPAKHKAWKLVAMGLGKSSTELALMTGAEVIIPSGGVGAGAFDKYERYLRSWFQQYVREANDTQRKFVPEIVRVPAEEVDIYELQGAEGHMRHLLSMTESH